MIFFVKILLKIYGKIKINLKMFLISQDLQQL